MDAVARVDLTVGIVTAYVSHNRLPAAELLDLIGSVHVGLAGLDRAVETQVPQVKKATPAEIRRSLSPDALISFEDGKSYKTLRRHLTLRGLTPYAYRAKWGLPADYPIVAPNYAAHRSSLARALGLGRSRQAAAPAPEAAVGEAGAPVRRARPKEQAA